LRNCEKLQMKLNKRVLYQQAHPINLDQKGFIKDLSDALFDTMLANNGIGLAAPQCGIPRQMFVMCTNNQNRTVVNPKILQTSENTCIMSEGCLSFPNEFLDIHRPENITVEYYNKDTERVIEKLSGLTARCFLHEFDHLQGITMHTRKQQS